jgi:hypothetical protein
MYVFDSRIQFPKVWLKISFDPSTGLLKKIFIKNNQKIRNEKGGGLFSRDSNPRWFEYYHFSIVFLSYITIVG